EDGIRDRNVTGVQTCALPISASFVKKDSPIERFRKQRDIDPGWSKEIWKQMGELGWLGLPFPESAGGLGTGFLDAALLLERLGRSEERRVGKEGSCWWAASTW